MKLKQIIIPLFLVIVLILTILAVRQIQQLFLRAKEVPADIVVDSANIIGPLPRPFQALAQGGEWNSQLNQPVDFQDIQPQLTVLKPRYIRLDHIFDFYVVVKQTDAGLDFNFSQLDKVVNQIISSGALPFISLSYTPPAISSRDLTSPPNDWLKWQETIQATVEHLSGRSQRNLANIYYEVWNEPDLFGKWTMKSGRWQPNQCQSLQSDYRCLYYYSLQGTINAVNTNPFKFGGPAITALKINFLKDFFNFVIDQRLRLDFLSWHRYSLNPDHFTNDLDEIEKLFQSFPGVAKIEKVISEAGPDSEVNAINDNHFSAAHTAFISRLLLDRVDLIFTFEVKDSFGDVDFWGRWGVVSYQNQLKPRYFALQALAELPGQQLAVSGEGSFVKAIAAREENRYQLLLINYDRRSLHSESVPISWQNLSPGQYQLRQAALDINHPVLETTSTIIINLTTTSLNQQFLMLPNSLLLLELTKL